MRFWAVLVVFGIVPWADARVTLAQDPALPITYSLVIAPTRGEERSVALGPRALQFDAIPGWHCDVSAERDTEHSSRAIFVMRHLTCRGPSPMPIRIASVSCCDDPECEPSQRHDAARVTLSAVAVGPHVTLECRSPVRVHRRAFVPSPPPRRPASAAPIER